MKTLPLVAAGGALLLLLTACAGPATESSSPGAANGSGGLEVTEVTAGVIPVADYTTIYLAQDLGFFEDEGLTVTTEVMQNAAAIVPGVMNGQIQFGAAAVPPVISAAAEGLPLVFVANTGDIAASSEEDMSSIAVSPTSNITSPEQLNGKVIAVNALQAILELAARQVIDDAGGDSTTVTWVAMPFPDMTAAVQRGDVDAAVLVEPFTSAAAEAGLELIATPFSDVFLRSETGAGFFTSQQFIAQAPNTVAAFTRAMDRAAEAAAADPQLIRDALVTYGGVDPAVAEGIKLPGFSAGVSVEAIERFIEVMKEQEFLTDSVPTASDLVHQ